MTTFAYDTYYTLSDSDGLNFTFTDTIDGLPDLIAVWWIWNDGQIREGHTFNNGVEISNPPYYPYDLANFVVNGTQAKAQPFDFRYGAPYACQLSGDIYLYAGADIQPPAGTRVQYTLSTPGIVYNGIVGGDGGISFSPDLPPGTEAVNYIIFVEASETINIISGASGDAIGLQWDGGSGPYFNLRGYDLSGHLIVDVVTDKSTYVVTPLAGLTEDAQYTFTVNGSIPTTLPVLTTNILLQLVSTGVRGNRIARFKITDNYGFDLLSLFKVGDGVPVTTFSGGGPYFYSVDFTGDASYYVTSDTSVVSNIIKLIPSVIIGTESLSSTQARLFWEATNGPWILYGGPDGPIETANPYYSFTNLEPGIEYIFYVEDSTGITSNDLLIDTPVLPILVTIGGLGPTSLLFSWTNGTGPFRADLSGTGYTDITSPYLITGLTPDTDYALTVYGDSSQSQTILLHTPLAVPPVGSIQFGMTWFFSP